MIISQTPYRVSFAGGGTDLPAFYRREYGAVLSVALAKHMYVTVGPRFEPNVRVGYHRTEIADSIEQIQHTIVREAVRKVGLAKHLEITTIGDIPAGTGMGSSSALTVGLLNALYAFQGAAVSAARLAEQACEIEIERLQKPIGRQDQYAAAYGGLNYIRFNPDDSVEVEPVPCRPTTLAELQSRTLLLYTEDQRDANEILARQSAGLGEQVPVLRKMRDLAHEMRCALSGAGDLDGFAELLHESWCLKRSLGFGIATSKVDAWYERARAAGAQGGKLLGAGGGGFLLLLADPECHPDVRAALGFPRELPFAVDRRGSRILFISEHEIA